MKEKEVKNNKYLSPNTYLEPRLRKVICKHCLIIANTYRVLTLGQELF